MKPYPRYKDSGIEWIGEIPDGWIRTKIRFLSSGEPNSFTDGDWVELPYITDKGIRLIQTGNVGIGRYREKGFRYVAQQTLEELNCTEIFPDDILICRLAAPVGRACLVPDIGNRMITAVDNCILKTKESYYPRFVVYQLTSKYYLDYVNFISRGGTRSRISKSMLGALDFVTPQLKEQSQIANYLDHKTKLIDTLIDKKQKQIELLKEQKTAIINQAVTKGLDPNVKMKNSGIEWLGEIPESWKFKRLKFISEIKTGESDTVNRDDNGKYPFFVRAQKVERKNTYSYDGEAVLTAGDGVGVGRVFHYINGKFDYHQRVYKISDFKGIVGKHFFYYMKENFHKEVMKISAKSTVDSLRLPMFLNFPVVFGSVDEQIHISNYLDHKTQLIDSLIEKKQKQIDQSNEYRTTLISEAVTGKIDVREYNG